MRLAIRHSTTYRYEPEASRAALRLRLFPTETTQQSVLDWSVTVNGDPVTPTLTDASGDRSAQWFHHGPVAGIEILVEGTVETRDRSGVLGRFGTVPPGLFLRRTAQTKPDGAIRALAEEAEGETQLERMHALSAVVSESMTWRKGVTDSATTAAQALALGSGVCQDLTHVLIAAARTLEVPARYVVGYLHDAEAPVAETHAWAELFIEGLGWIAFDPTHQVCPADAHVRLACGLDAADAAPIRGNVSGVHRESMSIAVSIGTQSQSQSQSQS